MSANTHFDALDSSEQSAVLAVIDHLQRSPSRASRVCSPTLLSHAQMIVEAELSCNVNEKRHALTALAAFACAELAKLPAKP